MIFITRRMYQNLQPPMVPGTNRLWTRRVQRYQRYRKVIAPLLPRSILALDDAGCHDATVLHVCRKGADLLLHLDVSDALTPYFSRKHDVVFLFRNARIDQALESVVRQHWLYNEVHLSAARRFALHVFFSGRDAVIEADDVEVRRCRHRRVKQ